MQYDLEKSSLQGMYYNAYLNIFLEKKKKNSFFFVVRIKELEQELKTVKKSYDMKMKKIEKKLSTECENSKLNKIKNLIINMINDNINNIFK